MAGKRLPIVRAAIYGDLLAAASAFDQNAYSDKWLYSLTAVTESPEDAADRAVRRSTLSPAAQELLRTILHPSETTLQLLCTSHHGWMTPRSIGLYFRDHRRWPQQKIEGALTEVKQYVHGE